MKFPPAQLALLGCFVFCANLHADPILSVNSSGQLTATGVTVNGNLYDVAFLDGTCVGIFGGCEVSDFTFSDSTSAGAASQALISLLSPTNYRVTGCTNSTGCFILTPYGMSSSTGAVLSAVTQTSFEPSLWSVLLNFSEGPNVDTTNDALVTWARWTPEAVPEPISFLSLSVGIFGLVSIRRRR
jgi:hypothetical protein